MGTPYSAILTLIVTAGVINMLMGIYALTGRSKVSMVKTFVVFSLLSAVYTFGSALELAAGSLQEIVFWIKFQYLGMPFLPPLNLLMIMYFLGMDKYLSRIVRIGLFIVPAITLALVLTNEAHHLYYRDIVLRADTLTPKADLVAGPWYIIAGAYTFGCMIGGAVLLLIYWGRKRTYRFQLFTMLVGLLLPLAGDFFYLGGVTPDGMDPIPVIMTVTSALYMWALASRGLFHVVPIARDNLFESMRDGVFVLDMEDRLVDYNAAAAEIMPELAASEIGQRLDRLWRLHTDAGLLRRETADAGPIKREMTDDSLLKRVTDAEKTSPGDGSEIQEIPWTVGDQSYHYQVRTSVVHTRGAQEAGKLIVLIDITQRVRLQEQLRQMAYYDGLTGAFNRARFMSLSMAMLKETESAGEPTAVVLFDIDHFKRINDTYGHDVGDQALLHIAELCRKALRPADLFARYGGEEFVMAMPGLSAERAEAAAHRIRRELAAQPLDVPGGKLRMTASFGIAATEGAEVGGTGATGADEAAKLKLKRLLKQADLALYAAKNAGRDAVRLAKGDSASA